MKNMCAGVLRCTCIAVWLFLSSSVVMAQVAVTTYHNDNYRSGSNPQETVLTRSNVRTQSFGKRATFAVQGYVYAQPLYLPGLTIGGTSHNVLFIATEHDQVYAFDVNSGQQLWHTNFLATTGFRYVISPVSSGDVGCGDMVPEIGITGTPAIDTTTGTMYLVAKTKRYDTVTHTTSFYQTLHALDIKTGQDKVAPLPITATSPGNGTGSVGGILTFDPLVEGQRSALLLLKGQVFIAWASHCDLGTYHGYVMSFSESTLVRSGLYVDTPNGYEGGFWGGGAGPAADSGGSIYAATGNGQFDGATGFGDSVLRLAWPSTFGAISLRDYFTPWNQQTLDQNDSDFGSGGAMLLPDQPGTPYPHLLIQVGKEGTIDLVNRDNMGHFHSGSDSQIVQTLRYAIGGIFGAPAFWNNTAYFGGAYDHLKAFAFDPHAQQLSTGSTSASPEFFNFPGPTPSVSSNGTNNGIVWIIESDTYGGGNAVLRAYDATNLGTELYNSEQNPGRDRVGLAVKFTVPTIADGRVFVGAENQVVMYGLL
jgi:outer membrane protein assembly factor BamB